MVDCDCHLPSLIGPTLGAWALEEMGALLAGVFWGVLFKMVLSVRLLDHQSTSEQYAKSVDEDWE